MAGVLSRSRRTVYGLHPVSARPKGALSRLVQVCGLTPDQQYRIMVDCGDEIGGAWNYDLYTATADEPEPPGTTAMPWSFGAPAPVLPTAERITVSWSATEDMASPTAVQETDCGSGCTVNIFPPDDTTSYVQWCWQTAADATLACSKPQAITTP